MPRRSTGRSPTTGRRTPGFKATGARWGGVTQVEHVARGGPLVVLYSVDLDATIERVRGAGGTIVTEPFEFPGGRRFHFTDPSGNELAVYAEQ